MSDSTPPALTPIDVYVPGSSEDPRDVTDLPGVMVHRGVVGSSGGRPCPSSTRSWRSSSIDGTFLAAPRNRALGQQETATAALSLYERKGNSAAAARAREQLR